MAIRYPQKINWSQLAPDEYPSEVLALDVPIVYDECSLHRYYLPIGAAPHPLPPEFVPTEDALMTYTLPALTHNATGVESFRVKDVTIQGITATPYPDGKYRTINVSYQIVLEAVIQETGFPSETVNYNINRTETRVMYCPAPPVNGTATWSFDLTTASAKDSPIFRLMLNNIYLNIALSAGLNTLTPTLAINLAYTALLKCEFAVQLLVPAYGFFIASKDCYPPVPIPTPTEAGFYPEINFDELIQP